MKVLKFGGTSVGSPERIEQLFPIITSQTADKHLVVLSAVSGTTNDLVALSELYAKKKTKLFKSILIYFTINIKVCKRTIQNRTRNFRSIGFYRQYISVTV